MAVQIENNQVHLKTPLASGTLIGASRRGSGAGTARSEVNCCFSKHYFYSPGTWVFSRMPNLTGFLTSPLTIHSFPCVSEWPDSFIAWMFLNIRANAPFHYRIGLPWWGWGECRRGLVSTQSCPAAVALTDVRFALLQNPLYNLPGSHHQASLEINKGVRHEFVDILKTHE